MSDRRRRLARERVAEPVTTELVTAGLPEQDVRAEAALDEALDGLVEGMRHRMARPERGALSRRVAGVRTTTGPSTSGDSAGGPDSAAGRVITPPADGRDGRGGDGPEETIRHLREELGHVRLAAAPASGRAASPEADAARLAARAEAAEEARRRLATQVAELTHRLEDAEHRSAELGKQLELTMEERVRAADGGGALRKRLFELEQQLAEARAALDRGSADERVVQLRATVAELQARVDTLEAEPAASPPDTEERLASLEAVVDTLRHGREEAERRAAAAENAHVADRRNLEILERELSAVRGERAVLQEALAAERRNLGPDGLPPELHQLAAMRAERDALADERDALVTEQLGLTERLAAAERAIAELETARTAAEAFSADTSHDLGEARGDLMEARERVEALEAEVAALTESQKDLREANDAQRLRMAAEREEAERNLVAQRRAHEALRADAVTAHEREMKKAMAAHEHAIHEVEAVVGEARARIEELSKNLQAVTTERDRLETDLEQSRRATDVVRQRLRDELEARSAADRHSAELEDELAYVRSEVLGADARKSKRGRFGRKPGGASTDRARRLAAAAAPPEPRAAALSQGPEAPVPVATSPEELEAALDRRLFGD